MDATSTLFVLIIFAGSYTAWSIGANDVANAMGTSVGSGALTLKKAIIIAAILEFSGAFFFGTPVSSTIQKGIIIPEAFAPTPLLLLLGMLSVLFAAAVWLQIATHFGWPVSATHTIIGAILGFGWVIGGSHAIYWNEVLYILLGWILSPCIGGVLSFIFFNILRKHIFYAEDPITRTYVLAPIIAFFMFFMLFLFITEEIFSLCLWKGYILSFCLGCLGFLVTHFLMKNIATRIQMEYHLIEKTFAFLQMVSACFMAFAHGANDVANAIGPLASSLNILSHHAIMVHETIPKWTLALGGLGIVIGLVTLGWRVIDTIGKKITELTPTRGFAAELSAASTILVASKFGLPVSTTHILVGAVIGVGLAKGLEAIDLRVIRSIITAWCITLPAGALLALAFFFELQWIFKGIVL